MLSYLSPLRPTGLSPPQMGRASYIIGNAKCKAGLLSKKQEERFSSLPVTALVI